MPHRLIACLISLVMALPAAAGPWARAEGKVFASTALRITYDPYVLMGMNPPATYTTFYLEYGLGRNMTLGIDAGHSASGAHKALVFLRYTTSLLPEPHLLSLELGAGEINGVPTLRPGLSYGRGIDLFGHSGWLTADLMAEITDGFASTNLKLDLTAGVNLSSRLKGMLQLHGGTHSGAEPVLRISAGLATQIGDERHVELGIATDLRSFSDMEMRVGLWQEF